MVTWHPFGIDGHQPSDRPFCSDVAYTRQRSSIKRTDRDSPSFLYTAAGDRLSTAPRTSGLCSPLPADRLPCGLIVPDYYRTFRALACIQAKFAHNRNEHRPPRRERIAAAAATVHRSVVIGGWVSEPSERRAMALFALAAAADVDVGCADVYANEERRHRRRLSIY